MENGACGRGSPHPMDYVETEAADHDDAPMRMGGDARDRPAREPAPGDANPLSAPEGRPMDRRERSP